MSIKDGPGEGAWSAFAEKVVAERDAAREEVARLRAEAKRADEEATALANSDLATTEQVVRALRVENDALRAKVRTITDQYKPGWVDGLTAVARSAGFDPDKLRHEGVDPPTFIEDVILGLRAENERMRRALVHIADTCVQDPDTAQFAARVLDGSADVGET